MGKLNQQKSTLYLDEKRRGSRPVYLVVILLVLFGQVAAQENTDRVAELITKLKSLNATDRARAANALREMGPEAKQAIPALIEAKVPKLDLELLN